MKQLKRYMVFKVKGKVVTKIDFNDLKISDIENISNIISYEYEVPIQEVELETEEVVEKQEMSELFVSNLGNLCFYNDLWNIEHVKGFSVIDSIDLNTIEGKKEFFRHIEENTVESIIKFN